VIVGEVGYGRLAAIAKTLEDFRLATTRIFPGRVVQSQPSATVVVVEPGHMRDYGPGRSGNVLARGRTAEALPYFKWVVDRGSQNVTEYFVAQAHYMRLTAR